MMRIHDVGHRLVGDSPHGSSDVPADLGGAAGVDQYHPVVSHDHGRIDHVPLVQRVRVLNRAKEDLQAVVHANRSRLRKALRPRCRPEKEQPDQGHDAWHSG